jgi:hypothetical protein
LASYTLLESAAILQEYVSSHAFASWIAGKQNSRRCCNRNTNAQ